MLGVGEDNLESLVRMNKCLRWVVQLQFTRPEKKEIKHEKFLLLISTVVAMSFVSVSIQQSSAQANNDESIVKQGLLPWILI